MYQDLSDFKFASDANLENIEECQDALFEAYIAITFLTKGDAHLIRESLIKARGVIKEMREKFGGKWSTEIS